MAEPTISDVLAAVAGLRADVMARIDRLQDTLTAIREDIGVNFSATDTVRRGNNNTRDELRSLADTVAGMQRQIHRLQADVANLTEH